MNTTFKTRSPSPLQVTGQQSYNRPLQVDIIHDEMKKLFGTYRFEATFEEDIQTTGTLKGIPGRVIAFLCTLKVGDKVVGQGRGATAINQVNKFIVRNIGFAYNASLIDAIVRSTKLLDVFRPDEIPHPWNKATAVISESHDSKEVHESSETITDKQKNYLLQLIQTNVTDEDEREGLLSQLCEFTKEEASLAIKRFAK